MRFKLTINTDSAAFDDDDCGYEIARILREVADEMQENGAITRGILRDINGNKCGEFMNSRRK